MIKYNFDLERSYLPRFKCGAEVGTGALLGAAAISAVGSLIGSGVSAHGASSTNASALSASAEENTKLRQWQEGMYMWQQKDALAAEQRANTEYNRRQQMNLQNTKELTEYLYKNFQSPAAQAKALRAAGLNPAMILGGSSGFGGSAMQAPESVNPSMGSVPSVPSASTMSIPQLENPMIHYASATGQMAQAFNLLMQGDKSGVETDTLRKTQQSLVTSAMEDAQLKQTARYSAEFHLALDKVNLPKKIKSEIELLDAKVNNAALEGKYIEAKTASEQILKTIHEQAFKKNSVELQYLDSMYQLKVNSMQAEIALNKQQTKTAKANEVSAYSSAALSDAQTKTENKLRPLKEKLSKQEISNLKEQLKGVRYDNIGKVLDSLDKAFGTDKGVGSYIKSVIVGIDQRDREQFVKNLMEYIEK